MNLPVDIQNAHPKVQAHYRKMIEDGQTPRWAEMCALQAPPGHSGTDKTFMEGRCNGEWLNDMPKRQADYIVREAKAAGIDTAGKYYHSGIANKRGWCDKEAWVSGRDDVVRVAKKRNLEVRGSINVDATQKDPPKKSVPLSKSALRNITGKRRPSEAEVSSAIKKHAPRWKQ